MGLSASQARLLSLTSRQHVVEHNAQCLQHKKMRLANDSDTAYSQYLNALSDTTIKTLQTNSTTGHMSWIDGTINNLMRYGTSEETTGGVFYVQDLNTGKLYIPKAITDKIASSTISGSTLDEKARSFAELFGVTYEKEDVNAEVVIQYNEALSKAWDKALGVDPEYILGNYNEATLIDNEITQKASLILSFLPAADSKGVFSGYGVDMGNGSVFTQYINDIIATYPGSSYYQAAYTAADIDNMKQAMEFINRLDLRVPQDTTDETAETIYKYSMLRMTAVDANGQEYLYKEAGEELDVNDKIALLLNGGTLRWEGDVTLNYSNEWMQYLTQTKEYVQDIDLYKDEVKDSNDTVVYRNNLTPTSGKMGDTLHKIFQNVSSSIANQTAYLASEGYTLVDVRNYKEYLSRKGAYESYMRNAKVYEYKPSDKVMAEYYENMYKAISIAGNGKVNEGYIESDEERCKNTTWVSNMIKNAQVILTTFDPQDNILSKTATALQTNINEVTDSNKIQKIAQEYEETLALIKQKDSKIDTILNALETEENALETETDALREVIDANIDKHFKVLG